MLKTPNCFIRECTHFLGVLQPDGTEATEINYCKAFPKGIPRSIAYGDDKHDQLIKGQTGNYIFSKG